MPTLASALRVLQRRLRREGVGTAEEFVQLLVDAPGFVAGLFSSDEFQAEAEAETAAMVARSTAEEQADLEAGALQADLDAARAAAEEARAEAAAADSRAAAQVEAARAMAEAARAEAEVAKAKAAVAQDALLAAQNELAVAMQESAMVDVVAEDTLASYERRLWAARDRAACELEVLCSEVATADRAACELEVLLSELAAAEEREREMANAETTIGFFAEQVAARLQNVMCPHTTAVADTFSDDSDESTPFDVVHSSDSEEETSVQDAATQVGATSDSVAIAEAMAEAVAEALGEDVADIQPKLQMLHCWQKHMDQSRWRCTMCKGSGESSFDDSICQTCGGAGWCN